MSIGLIEPSPRAVRAAKVAAKARGEEVSDDLSGIDMDKDQNKKKKRQNGSSD